jgi:hypothetical protein
MAGVLIVAAVAWAVALAAPHRSVWSDYTQDHLSALALREGKSVYAPMPASSVLGADSTDVSVNDHPPPYILALLPLGQLTYPVAFVVLAALNAAAGVLACLIVARELNWSMRTGMLVAVGLLLHPGTVACLCVGNVSLVLFLLITLGWREYRRARSELAGVWLGLATALKLFPGLLLVGLVVGRAWRSVMTAAAVIAACWAAAVFVVGFDDATFYVRSRAPENAKAFVSHGFNLSVAGVAHRTFGLPNSYSPWLGRAWVDPALAESLAWVLRTAVGLIVAFGLLRARGTQNYPDRAFTILVPGMLLLSPLTWLHAVTMMILPVAILARTETRTRLAVLIACAVAMCLNDRWIATQWVTYTGRDVPWTVNLVLLAPTWGMLGVLLLACLRREEGQKSHG